MAQHPNEILAKEKMGRPQIIAIIICVLLNALDGFDVLSISFAAPGIAREWGVSRGALGIVLSMELIGMAIGSILLGQMADKIGRKPVILSCLVFMVAGMFASSLAQNITSLSAYRLFTGLGIGGMLACTNAMVAELSNDKYRSLNVTIMAAGFPIGAIIGGAIASQLLISFDWRIVFIFGTVCTAALIPIVLFWLPESVSSIVARRPENALQKVNKILLKLGHKTLEKLPDRTAKVNGGGLLRLFEGSLLNITIILTFAYFAHIMTFYYILKWIPKLVVDMGYEPSSAGNVLVWANVGGAIGAILLGIFTRKFNIKWLVIGSLAAAFCFVSYFGRGQSDLLELSTVSAAAGFFTNAGVVGLYALIANYFPPEVRAGGTGFVIGMGRGGAALGPMLAGYLFEAGNSLQVVSIIMASGSVLALIALIFLGRQKTLNVK